MTSVERDVMNSLGSFSGSISLGGDCLCGEGDLSGDALGDV